MHLIYKRPESNHTSFYQRRTILTRPYTLSHLFTKLRIHRNLTKRALAQKCSVSEAYISNVESGSALPSIPYSLSCANEFGINPEWVKRVWLKEQVSQFEIALKKNLGIED